MRSGSQSGQKEEVEHGDEWLGMCWLHATWTRRSWQPTCVSMRETPASSTPSDEMEVRSAWSIRCISRSLGCSRTSRRMRAIVFGTSASSPSCPIGRRAAERRSCMVNTRLLNLGSSTRQLLLFADKELKAHGSFITREKRSVGLPGLPSRWLPVLLRRLSVLVHSLHNCTVSVHSTRAAPFGLVDAASLCLAADAPPPVRVCSRWQVSDLR